MTQPSSEPESDTGRNAKGQFVMGSNGGPGRPRGSRAKLGERFLEELYHAFEKHGAQAIEVVVKRQPDTFLKIVSNILPKELISMALNVSANVEFMDKDEARAFLRAYRYAQGEAPPPPEGELIAPGWRHDD